MSEDIHKTHGGASTRLKGKFTESCGWLPWTEWGEPNLEKHKLQTHEFACKVLPERHVGFGMKISHKECSTS